MNNTFKRARRDREDTTATAEQHQNGVDNSALVNDDINEKIKKCVEIALDRPAKGAKKADCGLPNPSNYASWFDKSNVLFTEEMVTSLIMRCTKVLSEEGMLVDAPAPVNICGDLHGQLYDLREMFSYDPSRRPPNQRYLFLGDYVDRGKFGVECLCVLMYYKVNYPDKVFMLRGNHETQSLGMQYGFYDECKRRYSIKLFKQFSTMFAFLPAAGLVAGRALCMHGGLSRELTSLDKLRKLKKPWMVPESGILCDLLWADPEEGVSGFGMSERGCSFTFGRNVVDRFCEKLDLDLIVRAHQVMEEGYKFFAGRKLVTVFSASNYCGEFDNCGAMLEMDENLVCRFRVHRPLNRAVLNFLKTQQQQQDGERPLTPPTPTGTARK